MSPEVQKHLRVEFEHRLHAYAVFYDASASDRRESTEDLRYRMAQWAMEPKDNPERFNQEGEVR